MFVQGRYCNVTTMQGRVENDITILRHACNSKTIMKGTLYDEAEMYARQQRTENPCSEAEIVPKMDQSPVLAIQ